MNNKLFRNCSLAIIIAIIATCTLLTTDTANAWATKTHGYSANVLLQDVENGYITIDGVDYRLPEEYAIALNEYPEAFRAGALGPDFYPDTITGQTYIHPYNAETGVGVGDWLILLVDAVNSMPKNSNERMKALAFTLGMAVHYAGDEFGHDFINAFAGGAYPAYVDTIKDAATGNLTKLFYILRHIMEEKYMDSQIIDRLGNTDVSAPEAFIIHTWIYNGPTSSGPAEIYSKYKEKIMTLYVYGYLIGWRTVLFNFAERYRNSQILESGIASNPLNTVKAYAWTAETVAYVDEWINDIDTAIEQLVVTFDDIAHDVLSDNLSGNHKGTPTIVEERLGAWIDEYGKYMAPWSDWITNGIAEIADTLSATKEWVKDQLGITELQEAWDKFLSGLYNAAIPWGLSLAGVDYETCKALYEDKNTELWLQFLLETNGDLWNDLGAFSRSLERFVKEPEILRKELETSRGPDDNYHEFMAYMEAYSRDPEALDAFYNTIMMGKLILMGPDNLNAFFKKYGVTSSFQNANGSVMIDEICIRIHTAKNNSIFDNYGTDDNVYINILKDGESVLTHAKILDASMEDDFQNGNWDTYYVELPYKMPPSQISLELRIEKLIPNGTLDDWTPDNIQINYRFCGKDVLPAQTVLDRKYTFSEAGQTLSLFIQATEEPLTYTTVLNPAIISYMKSNDNSTQWVNSENFLWSDMTARQNILYEVFHGFKPTIELSADRTTFRKGTQAMLTGVFTSYWNGVSKERRDKESLLTQVDETAQQACTGTVRIMDVRGETLQTLSGVIVNGIVTVDLSFLTPGTYILRADYDGDAFNGSAQSNIVIVTVTDDTSTENEAIVNPNGFVGHYSNGYDEVIIENKNGDYTMDVGLYRITSLTEGKLSFTSEEVIFDTMDDDGNPMTLLFYKNDNGLYTIRVEESSNEYLKQGTTFDNLIKSIETFTSGDYEYTLLNDGTAKITHYYGNATALVIPDTLDGYVVTVIGDRAFIERSLTSVTIPDSVTVIGDDAFSYCFRLTSVIIGNGVTQIENNPFRKCCLTDIVVSTSHPYLAAVDSILFSKSDQRLIYCNPMTAIPLGIRAIGNYAFYSYTSLTSVTIPDSVTAIGNYAFAACGSLTSVTIPDSMEVIGDCAFSYCDGLTDITISDGVTSIGMGAFSYCSSLTDITIPNSVTTIEDYAYYDCKCLKAITIPDSVTSIGEYAFRNCTSLSTVTIPGNVTFIADNAFIHIERVERMSREVIGWDNLVFTVIRNSYAEQYCIDNGLNYIYAES